MFELTNDKKPVIFSDIDGTLYDARKIVSPETLEDINFAIKNGADFNLCTGNPYFERMQNLSKIVPVRYFIGSSGGHIVDLETNKTIFKAEIAWDQFKKIYDLFKETDCQLIFWTDKEYYMARKDSVWNREILEYHFLTDKMRTSFPKIYEGEVIKPLKIEIYAGSYENLEARLDAIMDKLKGINDLDIVKTWTDIEIQAEGINKASAAEWMLKNVYNNLKLTTKDIMTIGDSNNDYSMIKLSEYSYAMANSSKLILQTAHYFTSAVEQNGLGEAILDYLYRFKNLAKEYLFHKK
ncbi:Cof-type HAD-IIB family hydrolase [Metamycoplasma hyosynoviae]|uniref:Cof-type HAD-IIB family hydrolase n=1 Tax=Metamycoplasma hyosynoviae TaxID=29559 RepID=UPI00235A24EA|nr:Cof-type HAD-IIB family hydrolase [Metamycoplasma hyosynoviae]MDC8921837.1 Cof-type HAD-IIB family hydrolase [Metamycoplasma hyosynoviae]MDD1373621.1 Cof-type HAD-IIB family hydrolase [Metamycoplasma hyosynoviae]MDD1375618.1 Cof-type HAD-IIB family hydrolase [Metamycoplasma hyosynoviae]MDD1376285.1 Cof-type HAD-IIB family hydrolase [Metamycoplasma hyosynoviae]MDD1377111.1 Cof-type HAD-IIB family hydrolase [Metamycoplasma hyosynoviae]